MSKKKDRKQKAVTKNKGKASKARTNKAPQSAADIRKELKALGKSWENAVNDHDADRALSFYHPRARLLYPKTPVIDGKQEIDKYWRPTLADSRTRMKFSPEKYVVEDGGTLATEYGHETVDWYENGMQHDTPKYLLVWTLSGGKWRVLYECYNPDK